MQTATKPATQCNCFVRHVTHPLDRGEVLDQLEYFRSIGDRQGTAFALMQLSPCPTRSTSVNH